MELLSFSKYSSNLSECKSLQPENAKVLPQSLIVCDLQNVRQEPIVFPSVKELNFKKSVIKKKKICLPHFFNYTDHSEILSMLKCKLRISYMFKPSYYYSVFSRSSNIHSKSLALNGGTEVSRVCHLPSCPILITLTFQLPEEVTHSVRLRRASGFDRSALQLTRA